LQPEREKPMNDGGTGHDILDFCERELVALGGRADEKKMAIIDE